MISHLSEFSRLALSRASMDTLSVAREIEIIEHYLSMEQMRYGDYMNVSTEIDPNAQDLEIPALIIQPLAENAVKYGSRTCPDALEIRLVVKTRPPDRLVLEVSNTGSWVAPGTANKKNSTGTGIENVRRRLDKYYAEQYRFEKHVGEGRVTFMISVPQVMASH